MLVKLKKIDNLIPYHSSCMGFDSSVRVDLNNGKTVELDSIPNKGIDYVIKVNSAKKVSKK